jgi:HD-GYP domain-containing protein (c-di-GMP phosphodiesterase class II)
MRVDLFTSDKLKIAGRKLSRNFDLRRLEEIDSLQGALKPSVIIGPARELAAIHPNRIEPLMQKGVRVIVTDAVPGTPMPRFPKEIIHCTLPKLDEREEWRILLAFLNNAYDLLVLQAENARTQRDLEELTHIGVLLSSEKDTDKLLELILTKSRMITNCDAGSLYLVEESEGRKRMLFKMAQNDSIALNLREMPLPLNKQSLAGYAILTGEILVIDNAYEIDPELPYAHARWVDKQIGYRNITILTVPLKNLKGEVVGALQLLNRKRDPKVRLIDPLTAMVMAQPFDEHAIELVSSLASLAAVTLEKNMLYESIQNLFEGFVKASVKAIESRDPTTSGHSERVALLSVGLAQAVDRLDDGPLARLRFSQEELRELRYASLLHDFGKVGVRERVLIKAKKLYPGDERELRTRAMFVRAAIRADGYKRQLDTLLRSGSAHFQQVHDKLSAELEEMEALLNGDLDLIWEANEPKVLAEGNFDRLKTIAERIYTTFDNEPIKLVTDEQIKVLSIPRGTLTEEERIDIESHVSHTYNFLLNIPWTKELKNVPEIAYKHHEKLNGRGYPQHLKVQHIPAQSRIMTICDIFDALTASDRPYKKAVSFERALDILNMERKDGMLDPQLLDAFIEAKVFDLVRVG